MVTFYHCRDDFAIKKLQFRRKKSTLLVIKNCVNNKIKSNEDDLNKTKRNGNNKKNGYWRN